MMASKRRMLQQSAAPSWAFRAPRLMSISAAYHDLSGVEDMRPRPTRTDITRLAVIAAALVLPIALTALRRGRGDYTKSAEFRAITGDYLI